MNQLKIYINNKQYDVKHSTICRSVLVFTKVVLKLEVVTFFRIKSNLSQSTQPVNTNHLSLTTKHIYIF